jgi:electron transfer flavoprotein alpha subunit
MSEILIIAEHVRGSVRPVTREVVSAAVELAGSAGATVTVAVVAPDPDALVSQVALEGVDQVLTVPVAGEATTDVLRHAVGALIGARSPQVVLGGFTVDGMGYAPAVAAELGLGFASDVVAADFEDGAVVVRRELYAGKVLAELELPSPALILLRPTTWPEAASGGTPETASVALDLPAARVRHRAYVDPPAADVDITKADVLLAIGRGIGEQGNVAVFEQLADRLGVTLAASRPLVDAGWLPPARQVGQSGNSVKPKLYLAFGISGAVQHLAGMKSASTIVAVNTDPDAPIFGVAHYGAVADAAEIAEELENLA